MAYGIVDILTMQPEYLQVITRPSIQDIKLIAHCHRKAFPRALSSLMGLTYCKKMLEWYVRDERAFIFYLKKNNQCIGYCGGLIVDGIHPSGSASSMIQYSFNEAVMAMIKRPWLFLHPEFVRKYRLVIKNVWRRILKAFLNYREQPKRVQKITPHAGLIVIGVDPDYQGKGFGTLLLQEFERQAALRGYKRFMLTVLKTNKRAITSYERNGWVIIKTDGLSLSMEKISA